MINVISGPKGTGKTKIILDKVAESVKEAKGNVVFITDKKINSSSIDFSVRCVYVEEYQIHSAEAFRGFINGMVAGNSDIQYLFIDGVTRIIGEKQRGLKKFFMNVKRLEKEYGFNVMMTMSVAKEDLPSYIQPYAN